MQYNPRFKYIFHSSCRVPWLDRDALTKKIDRLQKENIILQQKVEENFKNEEKEIKEVDVTTIGLMNYQVNVNVSI